VTTYDIVSGGKVVTIEADGYHVEPRSDDPFLVFEDRHGEKFLIKRSMVTAIERTDAPGRMAIGRLRHPDGRTVISITVQVEIEPDDDARYALPTGEVFSGEPFYRELEAGELVADPGDGVLVNDVAGSAPFDTSSVVERLQDILRDATRGDDTIMWRVTGVKA